MNVKLSIDDLEIEVGYELLYRIADNIGDHEDLQDVYHKLAGSTNPEVREAIAYYDNLSPETVELLLQDSEIDILERVLGNSDNISKVSDNVIKKVIEEHPVSDVLKAIINNYEHIDSDNPNAILELIVEKAENNYAVLGELAESWDAPKYILKRLQKHSDVEIRRKATESLDR